MSDSWEEEPCTPTFENTGHQAAPKKQPPIPKQCPATPFKRLKHINQALYSPETKLVTFDHNFNLTPSKFCLQRASPYNLPPPRQIHSSNPKAKQLFSNHVNLDPAILPFRKSSRNLFTRTEGVAGWQVEGEGSERRVRGALDMGNMDQPMMDINIPLPILEEVQSEEAMYMNPPTNYSESPKFTILSNKFENEFKINKILGSGCFGRVYEVRRKCDGRVFAVKKSIDKYKGNNSRNLILIEVQNFAKISNHKGRYNKYCVKFYEAWEENGHLFIQSELCHEGSLNQYLERLPYEYRNNENFLRNIFAQMCKGVIHVHEAGFIHCDVKPSNFQVYRNDFNVENDIIIKLSDFGQAVEQGNVNMNTFEEGDSTYIAPDIFDLNSVSTKSDIFSLGLSFYELLTQTYLPQNGEEWSKFRNNTIFFPEWTICSYSKPLLELIVQMLQKEIEHRPELQSIIENPLFLYFSQGSVISERTPSPDVHQTNMEGIQQFLLDEEELFGNGSEEKGEGEVEVEGEGEGRMKFNTNLVLDYENLKERNMPKEETHLGILKMKPLNLLNMFDD